MDCINRTRDWKRESRDAQPITGRVDWVMWAPTTDCDWTAIGPRTHFFVTDRQKRDYLSRALQRMRGATKNAISHCSPAKKNIKKPHHARLYLANRDGTVADCSSGRRGGVIIRLEVSHIYCIHACM